MSVIKIKVDDQQIALINMPVIASGGVEENQVEFEFSSDWLGFACVACFYRDDKAYTSFVSAEGIAKVPYEVTATDGKMWFGIMGIKDGVTKTSELVFYKILQGAITQEFDPGEPTPDIYNQILDYVSGVVGVEQKISYLESKSSRNAEDIAAQTGRIDNIINSQTNTEVTTLWTGTINKKDQTATLSENISNFDFIDVYVGGSDTVFSRMPVSNSVHFEIETQNMSDDASSQFLRWWETGLIISGTTATILKATKCYWDDFSQHPVVSLATDGGIDIVRIDGVKIGHIEDDEIVDARVGENGVVYPNLGDAIRTQISDLKSALNSSNKGEIYLNDNLFEIGSIGFLEDSWSYYASNSRVRTKQGVTYHLEAGDVISLSDYSDARYYVGWINGDNEYKNQGWLTQDFVVYEEGDYALLLSNITEVPLSSVVPLLSLLSIQFVRTDKSLTKSNYPADAKIVGERFDSVENDVFRITYMDINKSFSVDQFEMGYYSSVAVGEAVRFYSSNNRFSNKRGTSFHFRKGTVIHVSTSIFEANGCGYWLFKLDENGMYVTTIGVINKDYVIAEEADYCISFRKNTESAITSISDYLNNISLDLYMPSVLSDENYDGFITNDNYDLPFVTMNGWYNTAGNPETPNETSKEKYTTMIPVPSSKRIQFDLSFSEARSIWARIYTVNESGIKVDYRTLAGGVLGSSIRFIADFTESEKYVIFTYRSYGDATVSAKACYGYDAITSKENVPFYSMITPPKVRLVNHRGYETVAPENSIPAFELAGENGAFGVECDVSSTSDGYLVIMHDNTVDRTTDGSGTVTNLTYAQIQQMHIDAGANVDQYSQDELIIPTFEDYIKICRKYGMFAIIEVKLFGDLSNYVESMLETIYSYGMQNSCMILTSNNDVIKMFRAYDSLIQITVFANATEIVDQYKSFGNMGISIDKTNLNIASLSKYAHLNNMHVNIYVSDDTSENELLKQYYPDFITTETTNV